MIACHTCVKKPMTYLWLEEAMMRAAANCVRQLCGQTTTIVASLVESCAPACDVSRVVTSTYS